MVLFCVLHKVYRKSNGFPQHDMYDMVKPQQWKSLFYGLTDVNVTEGYINRNGVENSPCLWEILSQ